MRDPAFCHGTLHHRTTRRFTPFTSTRKVRLRIAPKARRVILGVKGKQSRTQRAHVSFQASQESRCPWAKTPLPAATGARFFTMSSSCTTRRRRVSAMSCRFVSITEFWKGQGSIPNKFSRASPPHRPSGARPHLLSWRQHMHRICSYRYANTS